MRGFLLLGFIGSCANATAAETLTADVWLSPRMPMAMQEWPTLSRIFTELGIAVRHIRDPRVSVSEWADATHSAGWKQDAGFLPPPPQVKAPEHYPAVILEVKGKAHPWPVLGVMPEAAWRLTIAQRIEDLRTQKLPTSPGITHLAAASRMDDEPIQAACIPPLTYIPMKGPDALRELGGYERISPDGRFILRSFSGGKLGQVALVELPTHGADDLKLYPTPLRNEAFPVQGSWRFLVDIDGVHFRFRDVLLDGVKAKSQFKAGMTGFYASSSEMPSTGTMVYLRSLSWPQPEINAASSGGDDAAVGPLQVQTVSIADDWPRANTSRVVQRTAPQFICTQRGAIDGPIYALPMLSMDGLAFSAIPQMPITARSGPLSMRTYALARQPMATQHPCELLHDLGKAPSKAVFGPDESNKSDQAAWMVFTDNSAVHVVDRRMSSTGSFPIPVGKYDVLASAFPGVTADGRIIYAATWRDCEASHCSTQAGYVIADPYQIPDLRQAWQKAGVAAKACISHDEVAAQRSAFSAFHQLPIHPAHTVQNAPTKK